MYLRFQTTPKNKIMAEEKDYSILTMEELLTEEKKIKKSETLTAFLIGFIFAVLVYGIAKKGIGFLHIALPLFLGSAVLKNSQNQKQKLKLVQAKINSKQA